MPEVAGRARLRAMPRAGGGDPSRPTHQRHAQESHACVCELVVPQHQGHQPLPLLLEALTDVGQTWGRPMGKSRLWSALSQGTGT